MGKSLIKFVFHDISSGPFENLGLDKKPSLKQSIGCSDAGSPQLVHLSLQLRIVLFEAFIVLLKGLKPVHHHGQERCLSFLHLKEYTRLLLRGAADTLCLGLMHAIDQESASRGLTHG